MVKLSPAMRVDPAISYATVAKKSEKRQILSTAKGQSSSRQKASSQYCPKIEIDGFLQRFQMHYQMIIEIQWEERDID